MTSSASTTTDADSLTVWISRTVKPGCEQAYEAALHAFAQRTLGLHGQLGVHIMRPAPGSGSREYRVVRKFSSHEALADFKRSAVYAEWNQAVRAFTEGEPRFDELAGLESWFTPQGGVLRPLPRWKMACITFLGVYPLTSLLPRLISALLPGWPPLAVNLVVTAVIVSALTWALMPALTRLFRSWLHA